MLSFSVISRITLQGTPAAKELAGISLVTTLPAPITHPSPMVTPGQTVTDAPNQQDVYKRQYQTAGRENPRDQRHAQHRRRAVVTAANRHLFPAVQAADRRAQTRAHLRRQLDAGFAGDAVVVEAGGRAVAVPQIRCV